MVSAIKKDASTCPVCKDLNIVDMIKRKNHSYSRFWNEKGKNPELDLVISLCRSCGMVFQRSAYTELAYERNFKRIYSTYTLMDSSSKVFPSKDIYYSDALKFLVNNISKNFAGNVLEVGSNRGDFLYLLKSKMPKANVVGVEPSCLPYYGVPTVNGFFNKNMFSNKFDLIVIRHVLEHVKNPTEILKHAVDLLGPEGMMFIEVPNFETDMKELLEPFITEHIGYYSESVMKFLIGDLGLKVINSFKGNPNGLYFLVAKGKKRNIKTSVRDVNKIEKLVKHFIEKQNEMLKLIKLSIGRGVPIVFYGFGNIFLAVHSSLTTLLSKKDLEKLKIEILEDWEKGPGTKYKNIAVKRPEDLDKDKEYAFIICTMNRAHIKIMFRKICKKFKNSKIFIPWNKLYLKSIFKS